MAKTGRKVTAAKSSRKSSKSKRPAYSPWSTDGAAGETRAERHKNVRDRIAATKKNSKKKQLQAKYRRPKDTPELKAERIAQAQQAARHAFERWLNTPAALEMAAEWRRYPVDVRFGRLVCYVEHNLAAE